MSCTGSPYKTRETYSFAVFTWTFNSRLNSRYVICLRIRYHDSRNLEGPWTYELLLGKELLREVCLIVSHFDECRRTSTRDGKLGQCRPGVGEKLLVFVLRVEQHGVSCVCSWLSGAKPINTKDASRSRPHVWAALVKVECPKTCGCYPRPKTLHCAFLLE